MKGAPGVKPGAGTRARPRRAASSDAVRDGLYRVYYPRVFAFVYGRVMDVDLAKELTAEAFGRARSRHYEPAGVPSQAPRLFRIAKEVVARYLRESGWPRQPPASLAPAPAPRALPQATEVPAAQAELLGRLLVEMQALPQRDQELLSLRFDAQLSCTQIAKVMKMTDADVRVGVLRALKKLRNRTTGVAG